MGLLVGQDRLGHIAVIEQPGAFDSQRLEGGGQLGHTDEIAHLPQAAVRAAEDGRAFGGEQQDRLDQPADEGLHLADRAALAHQADGRLQQHAERQPAGLLGQLAEPGHVARHGHRAAADVEMLLRDAVVDRDLLKIDRVRRCRLRPAQARRGAEEIDQVAVAALRVINQRKAAAADRREGVFRDERGKGGGHGRIDRVAALLEHLRTCGSGQWMAGGNGAAGWRKLLSHGLMSWQGSDSAADATVHPVIPMLASKAEQDADGCNSYVLQL